MGKRGPKPKPLHLRKLEGGRIRVSISPDQVTIGSELPPAKPGSVLDDPLQEAEWDRIVLATPPDFYNALDSALLTLYVQALAMMHDAQRDILARGHFITVTKVSKSGEPYDAEETNPSIGIWKTASETVLKCADRLGLAPGARARLQLPKRGEAPPSKFGDLLGQRRLPAP